MYTKEPWTFSHYNNGFDIGLPWPDDPLNPPPWPQALGRVIARVLGDSEESADNAYRIFQCVNACAGLDPEKIQALIEAAEKAIPVLANVCVGIVTYKELDQTINNLRHALAAVRGKG